MRARALGTLLALTAALGSVAAQSTYLLNGQVVDANSRQPLPFVHGTINDGANHFLTDAKGRFALTLSQPVRRVRFETYGYRKLLYETDLNQGISLYVELAQETIASFETSTDPKTAALVDSILAHREQNDPAQQGPHWYRTYSKLVLDSDKPHISRGLLKWLYGGDTTGTYGGPHHLLINESTTERRYLDRIHEDEDILGSRLSGLERPRLFTANANLQPFSIYNPWFEPARETFVSPLAPGSLKRYFFRLVDSATVEGVPIYVLHFTPNLKRHFRSLSGLLYVNGETFAVERFVVEPGLPYELNLRIVQDTREIENGTRFPTLTLTQLRLTGVGKQNAELVGQVETFYTNLVRDTTFSKDDFTEVVIDYRNEQSFRAEPYWQAVRPAPLTDKEQNTYAFYDSLGAPRDLQRLLIVGEGLYLRRIPLYVVDISIPYLLTANDVEGLRPGLGLVTDPRVSKRIRLGGHTGFGTKDERWKWGAFGEALLIPSAELWAHVGYTDDVVETGRTGRVAFDRYQHSSEWLRKLRIQRMDWVERWSYALRFRAARNLNIQVNYSRSDNTVSDGYRFEGQPDAHFGYEEIGVGFRWDYGMRYLRFYREKIPLGTTYPTLWVQATQGLDGNLGEFNYLKLESKVNWSKSVVGWGTTNLQLAGGWIDRSVPYFQAFNAKGSERVLTVAHNSFETMGYNEFLATRYLNFHFSHDFGWLYSFFNPGFRPRFEVAQNIGFGSLISPEDHSGVPIRSYEKGYYESGVLVNNLLSFNSLLIKVGFGVGLYYRYGPYQKEEASDNLFIKVATTFRL